MSNQHLIDAETHSGLQTHLGYRLVAWSDGAAVVEMDIRPEILNRQNIPHGGVHAVLLDTAMGYCGCFTGDTEKRQLALTLSMTVNYLGQAKGTRLIATGRRTGGGRSTFFAEAQVADDLGNPVATATGVFRYRPALAR